MTGARDQYEQAIAEAPDNSALPNAALVSYRSVFGHGTGTNVLADMLVDLKLFSKLDGSETQTAEHNHAVELLRSVGILKPDSMGKLSQVDMRKIVSALMNVQE